MRKPDETLTVTRNSHNIDVSIWVDPTEFAWDGEYELDPGCDGFDVYVKVALTIDNQTFKGSSSLANIWIVPNKEGNEYMDEEKKNIINRAIDDLTSEINKTKWNHYVAQEMKRADVARTINLTEPNNVTEMNSLTESKFT